jgi:hypothetical protein
MNTEMLLLLSLRIAAAAAAAAAILATCALHTLPHIS